MFLWFRFFNFYQSCILPKNVYKKLVSRSLNVDWGQILSRAKVNGWVIKPVYYSSNVYGLGLSIIRTFCSRWPYSGIFVFGFSKLTCFWSGMIECVFSEFDYLHRRWKMFEVRLPDKIPDKYLISDISPIKVTMCHFMSFRGHPRGQFIFEWLWYRYSCTLHVTLSPINTKY